MISDRVQVPDVATYAQVSPNMLISSPRVIAIVNQKGGVGKTTTALNLGAAIAERGSPVLVIDIDPQANCTSGLGLDPRRARWTVYDLLAGEARVDEVAIATAVDDLWLVPSTSSLAGAEIELASQPHREGRLRQALGDLAGGFGYVLIDCPPSLGLLTLNGLVGATEMLVPLQCEFFALEGLAHLLETQQLVRMRLNQRLELGGIVMTQFDARTSLAWEVLADVRSRYSDKLYGTLIPRNVRVSEASSHGQPVTMYDPLCRGALAYRQLAEEVMST